MTERINIVERGEVLGGGKLLFVVTHHVRKLLLGQFSIPVLVISLEHGVNLKY